MNHSPGKSLLVRNQTQQEPPKGGLAGGQSPACLPRFTQPLSAPQTLSHQGPGYAPGSFNKWPLPLAGLTGEVSSCSAQFLSLLSSY